MDFFCPITRHVHVNQCFTAVPRKLQAQNMSQLAANLTVPGVCVLETIDLWSFDLLGAIHILIGARNH